MTSVNCKTHGLQPGTLVCQHIVQGLKERKRVGFFWAMDDPDNLCPDAWCKACNERVKLTGGEWTGEALEQLEPRALCSACYGAARIFHAGGNPWS